MPCDVLNAWEDKLIRRIVELINELCPIGGEPLIRRGRRRDRDISMAHDPRLLAVVPET